jgi:c-di-GMP-binding flagellar brake protein YcgR
MQSTNPDILREAIARNAAMVLSLPSAGMMRHHKSRFLADDADGFWVESCAAERLLIDQLVQSQEAVGISFKSGTSKVVLATTLIGRQAEYHLNAQTVVEALHVRFPAELKAIQRRNNYRVRVRPDDELKVRVWRIATAARLQDRPMAKQELRAEVRDISLGGVGVILYGEEGDPPRVTTEDRLRIELAFHEGTLLLEGCMVYPPAIPARDAVRVGIRFESLQNGLEGRQASAKLTRIVGELQRDEVRRFWLGLGQTA